MSALTIFTQTLTVCQSWGVCRNSKRAILWIGSIVKSFYSDFERRREGVFILSTCTSLLSCLYNIYKIHSESNAKILKYSISRDEYLSLKGISFVHRGTKYDLTCVTLKIFICEFVFLFLPVLHSFCVYSSLCDDVYKMQIKDLNWVC